MHAGGQKGIEKPQRVRRKWSKEEKEAVDRHLLTQILRKRPPVKEEIIDCMSNETALSDRTWRSVRDHCRNRIAQAKKESIMD
jgi:hypothetical protein